MVLCCLASWGLAARASGSDVPRDSAGTGHDAWTFDLWVLATSSPGPPSLLCPSSPHGYPMLEALQEQDSVWVHV